MPKTKAAWTVMVYLAGDNNLTAECLFALTEMKKALPGKHINVIAQFDPKDEYLPTHRYEINRKGPHTTLFDDIIDEARYNLVSGEVEFKFESERAKSLAATRTKRSRAVKELLDSAQDLSTLSFVEEETKDDTDTGSPVTLYNFLSFGIQEYPAHHYLVALSGHAGGVETDYLLKDESSKGSLTFNELKQVFRELKDDLGGQAIDIVGMDNCLMSMGEICYELRGLANIIVGCESFSPASGWPYRQILERLRKDSAVAKGSGKKSVKLVAKGIVEEYVNYYSPYWMSGMSVSQSALDVRRVDELRQCINRLADAMETELRNEVEGSHGKRRSTGLSFKDSLVLTHWETQSYNGERFVDLYDFCACLERRSPPPNVTKRCQELRKFISDEFVIKTCYSGAAYQYSYGVSIYFPWAQIAAKYQNLDFVRDSERGGWFSFLKIYTQVTRRLPRGFDKKLAAELRSQGGGTAISLRMTEDRMTEDRMTEDRMTEDRMTEDRMTEDRMTEDRMTEDRMTEDRMTEDRMTEDRMMSSEAARISSMRNPPVVFLPTDCIKETHKSLMVMKRFFGASKSRRRRSS